jgi:hypothetical protein
MTIALDSLTTPLTRQEVQASIYQVLAANGVTTTTWKPGSVVRTFIVGTSIILSALSTLQAKIARSGFLDLSEGDWLTLVAFYVYFVARDVATFAPGEVTLVNTGGGVFSFDPDDVIVSNPGTGKTYRNTEAFELAALETLTIAIRATEAGSASTSAPGEISVLETTLNGVTCSNADAVVGQDAEGDPALRLRCREKLGSLSPFGPWDAYGYAVRNAKRADGTSVGATRVRINKDGFGFVYVWAASASGAIAGTVGDLDTDLGCVDDAVQRQAAPINDTAIVDTAAEVAIPVTYEIWMYNTSGRTPAEVQSAVLARLVSFMQSQPIGGNVVPPAGGRIYTDAIQTVIEATLPEIFRVVVTLPAGAYTALAISEVPVLGTVICTAINQVSPPEGAA